MYRFIYYSENYLYKLERKPLNYSLIEQYDIDTEVQNKQTKTI